MRRSAGDARSYRRQRIVTAVAATAIAPIWTSDPTITAAVCESSTSRRFEGQVTPSSHRSELGVTSRMASWPSVASVQAPITAARAVASSSRPEGNASTKWRKSAKTIDPSENPIVNSVESFATVRTPKNELRPMSVISLPLPFRGRRTQAMSPAVTNARPAAQASTAVAAGFSTWSLVNTSTHAATTTPRVNVQIATALRVVIRTTVASCSGARLPQQGCQRGAAQLGLRDEPRGAGLLDA